MAKCSSREDAVPHLVNIQYSRKRDAKFLSDIKTHGSARLCKEDKPLTRWDPDGADGVERVGHARRGSASLATTYLDRFGTYASLPRLVREPPANQMQQRSPGSADPLCLSALRSRVDEGPRRALKAEKRETNEM